MGIRRHQVNPDLTDPTSWVYWPVVCRVLGEFEPNWVERGGHDQTRRLLARIIWGDPTIRLDIVTEHELVFAVSLSTLEMEGRSRWVFCQVGWVEQGVPRTIATQHIQDLKDWGRQHDAQWLVWGSRREPGAMARRFKTTADGSVLHRIPIKDD